MTSPTLTQASSCQVALDDALSSVFAPLAIDLGLSDGAITLKKLQILYWLRSRHPVTIPEVIRELTQWRGTGRNEMVAFEDAQTAPALVEQMVKDELMWEVGIPLKRLVVSPKAITLLSKLHPACEDLDLVWRLRRWEQGRPEAVDDAMRYGSVLAAKQREFVFREPDQGDRRF